MNRRPILSLGFQTLWFLHTILFLGVCFAGQGGGHRNSESLTVIALGDAGEDTDELRANADLIEDMYTGKHKDGEFDVMVFLGDNFYTTGLNIPADEVDDKVEATLGRLSVAMEGLGRANVHAIPGNHDYYARNVLDASVLFGLIDIEVGPIGFTEKGIKREAAIRYWTYHYKMPAAAIYPLSPGSSDSVQLIFFDSAVLLRTGLHTWRPSLDSLQKLLAGTRDRPGISWRVLCTHHPFYSLGEHGGYTEWDDERSRVEYLTQCDKDTNALGWLKNWIDPEDLCAEKYRQYIDSVKAAIRASGAKIQLILSGHEHSLQLLYYPGRDSGCAECPSVQIISGAAAKPERVRASSPPYEFTSAHPSPRMKGISVPGFVQLQFDKERVRADFFDANDGERLDMGNGRTEFWIDRNGSLVNK